MMKNFKDRYDYIKEKLDISDNYVGRLIGIAGGTIATYLSRNHKIHDDAILALCQKYDIDQDWLINGTGDPPTHLKPVRRTAGVPFYDIEITGSIRQSIGDIRESPEYTIDYKPFNDCTAYLPIYGDSMFPKFKNGEVLAVKQVNNINSIQWGESYLVITSPEGNEMKTVKTVHPSDNNDEIILRASNPNYKGDQPVKKAHILSMYIVKGKISRDVM